MTGPLHDCPDGDELDCPVCRASLLVAFTSSQPEPLDHMDLTGYFSRPPSMYDGLPLMNPVPPDRGRCGLCEHPGHSELHCRPGCNCSGGTPVSWRTVSRTSGRHTVVYAAEDSHPSFWVVKCSCGYRSGSHASDPRLAESVAHSTAVHHARYPEKRS